MKRKAVVGFLLVVLFLVSMFPLGRARQPPIDTSTYYVGTIGQPKNLDPAVAYDTASGEIIQNVYQPLIWYADKHPITFTSTNATTGYNLSASDISDLTKYTPVIATQVPTDTNGGIIRNYAGNSDELWTFTINTNAQFPSWTDGSGNNVISHNVTVDDIVYSFQRQLVYDSDISPDWMWIATAFNPGWATFSSAFSDFANGTFVNATVEGQVATLIQSWVWGNSNTNQVFFHFLHPFADVAMYQIFSETWGSIVEKAWVIEHGGWTGAFYSGWSNDYRRKPSNSYSELDRYKDPAKYGAAGSKYTSGTRDIPDMLGTGPYKFTSWDTTTQTWRIDYNPNYWRGWGNAGDKAGNFIHAVIEKGIGNWSVDDWPTRKTMFLNGEFDDAVVPRASMSDLLTSTYNPIAGISLVYNIPTLINDAIFFTMNVSSASAYQSYVGPPGSHSTGPIATFFADDHIRRAFAWAINYTDYINSAYFGEAIQHGSWWVTGLTPTAANDSFLTLRDINAANMKAELDQAALIGGRNVSTDGFDVTFLYNTGNDQRRIAAQTLANAWQSINSKYHVSVTAAPWSTFVNLMGNYDIPGYSLGWLEDFADAADFAGTYMSSESWGWFSHFQGTHNVMPYDVGTYPADQAAIDAEVTQAATEANVTARVNEYHDLEYRYWNDCISISLDQPLGRRFARDWVQGWYYNALLPGLYAYDLYKSLANFVLWNPSRDSYSQINYASIWAGGNCYGLSTTEILYFTHYILGDPAYPYFPAQNPSATKTSDLNLPTNHNVLNDASLAVMFHQVYDPNNMYIIYPPPSENVEYAKLMAELESGTPALLAMAGRVDSTGSAAYHAIVAYGVLSNSNGIVSIEVSDPNVPQTGGIANYDPSTQTFSYSAAGLSFFQFEVITLGMIQNSFAWTPWYNSGSGWWLGWLSWSVQNYYLVIASKMVTINSNGLLDYFTSAGNSQTFVKGIPGSCGIEEGNVQVYAIPKGTPFYVQDPGSTESTILITMVDNESGQPVGSGYFLNATTTQGFLNYTVTPSNAGLSLSTGDNGLNASVTLFSATLQDHSVSQPLNVQVDQAQAVNFTALYVTNLVPSKNIVSHEYNVPVNMTIVNMAGSPENVNLTVFANTTAIDTEIIPSLTNGTSTYSFVWNTSSLAYGNYTITASVLTNDTAIAGGNCTFQTTVSISIAGDINGDGKVNILDAIILSNHFFQKPPWNQEAANADINSDGIVNILDAIILSNHFLQQLP